MWILVTSSYLFALSCALHQCKIGTNRHSANLVLTHEQRPKALPAAAPVDSTTAPATCESCWLKERSSPWFDPRASRVKHNSPPTVSSGFTPVWSRVLTQWGSKVVKAKLNRERLRKRIFTFPHFILIISPMFYFLPFYSSAGYLQAKKCKTFKIYLHGAKRKRYCMIFNIVASFSFPMK